MRNVSAFQPNTAAGTTKAYYPLNGNSRDYSGQTNTGTDTAITYPQGRFGQGAKFNGSSSQISLPNITAISGGTPRTISAWIKTDVLDTSLDSIFSYGANTNNLLCDLLINVSNAGDIYWAFSSNDYLTGGNAIKINKWHLITAVYDGGTLSTTTIKIYVDGISQTVTKTGAGSGVANTTDANYAIGYDKLVGGRNFNGIIDEVIIESRAWTAKEVETYYRKSMLNYGRKTWAQMLISFIISEVATLTETVSTLRQRRFSVSETTTLTEAWTTARGKIFSIIESVNLSETLSTTRSFVFNVAESVGLTEVLVQVKRKWNEVVKSVSSWTNGSKNSSTWTDESKNSSTYTNPPKN